MMEKISFEKIEKQLGDKGKLFKEIRKYALILLAGLFIIQIAAFFAYRWVENNEMRSELLTYYNTNLYQKSGVYYNGIITLKNDSADKKDGFYEQRIEGSEYLIYSPSGTNLIFAKSERETSSELSRVGIILVALYIAELILFFGW